MCGISQGSTLGPIIFILYVTDIYIKYVFQFTDHPTLYKRCEVKDISDCANIILKDLPLKFHKSNYSYTYK